MDDILDALGPNGWWMGEDILDDPPRESLIVTPRRTVGVNGLEETRYQEFAIRYSHHPVTY